MNSPRRVTVPMSFYKRNYAPPTIWERLVKFFKRPIHFHWPICLSDHDD
jgi:hypothetical protein